MKEKVKQQQAITLIALVITIIILLILAGVTIGAITGDKAIIKEANGAKNSTEMKALEEQIELAIIKVEKNHRNPTMEQVSTEIEKIEHVTRVDRETGDIENDLGDPITGKLDDYLGKKTPGGNNTPGGNTSGNNTSGGDTVTVPDLKETDVEFIPSKTGWTNESITVTINNKVTGYTLQYSKDGSNWSKYTTPVTMDQNGTIKVRLLDEKSGRTGGSVSKGITNIDKLPPNTFTPTATSTTNSITLTGSTTDQTATATNGSSGVVKYYFSKDDGATWEPTEGQAGTSYTFEGLTQNQNFTLKMKAVDEAGNGMESNSLSKSTSEVPDLVESDTTFQYSETDWTNQDVIVTINQTVGNQYSIQYSKGDPTDESTWQDYTTPVVMTGNGAIYARLKDSTGQTGRYATGNVTNIDKVGPKAYLRIYDETYWFTHTQPLLTAKDDESGIEKCELYVGEKLKGTYTSELQSEQILVEDLTPGMTYTFKLKVTDKAGNIAESSQNIKMKEMVTDLMVGEYTNYVDGKGITRKCVVLWDKESNYGIQIITKESVEDVIIGAHSSATTSWMNDYNSDYLNKVKTAYNNAIITLNGKARTYLNSTYATSARSVGSLPNNPNYEPSNYYSNSEYSFMSRYNNLFKASDNNCDLDVNQLYSKESLKRTNKKYWIASRNVQAFLLSGEHYLSVNVSSANTDIPSVIGDGQMLDSRPECKEWRECYRTYSKGLRPVFTLKSTLKVISGKGWENDPYILGTP